MSLLVLAILVLLVGWAGASYFGPGLFKTASEPDDKTRPSNGNHTLSVSGERANLLVDFDNGTRVWFNITVPRDWNYYNVTTKVTEGDIVARWFGYTIQSHFIYKILGFGCDPDQFSCPGYWSLWVWNETGYCWDYSIKGVDLLQVSTIGMVAWRFSNYDGADTFEGRCS